MSKKQGKKVWKWLNNITTVLLFTILIGMLAVVIISKFSGGEPGIFGYQLKTVLSGSMEPGIKTGSIIAVKPGGDMTRFKENDVITFQADEKTVITHRIVDVTKSGEHTIYQTKGDNNNAPDMDPVLSENVVGEYTGFTIPYVGYFSNFVQSKNGAFLLLIPGILLLGYSIFIIWKTLSEVEASNQRDKGQVKESAEASS
ncbi:signal peptidase I [Virgibacillus dakarensis]|uniref:Signal peptidase I n=1 Tax=Lentibacillus populi TaxID=1827502 RepID=A0A9W5TY10_9BACI|nr:MULTISPECIES: signal peptidase I [Bacillaceae]MBT2216905.1 signal peptidase I [Virgibacillus dakarensis]MTW85311.1 signal peptidase I [Virgibacillus dakarensis]GGB45405.1 S26 family signal peptidase [Lentibacillus populi]